MNYKDTNSIEYVKIDFPSYYEKYTVERIEDIERFVLDITNSLNGFGTTIVKARTNNEDCVYINTNSIVQFFVKHYN